MRWPLAAFVCGVLGLTAGAAGRWLTWWPQADGRSRLDRSGLSADRVAAEALAGGKSAVADVGSTFPEPPDEGPQLSVDDLAKLSGFDFTDRLARWLPGASADEVSRMLEVVKLKHVPLAVSDALYTRWAELDPAGAIQQARERGWPTYRCWAAWGKVAPDQAFAEAAKIGNEAVREVLLSIARVDPEKARLLGKDYPALFREALMQQALAGGMARSDPLGALQTAFRANSIETHGILEQWAAKEPDAAMDGVLAMGDRAMRDSCVRLLCESWATTQPERVAVLIDRLPPGRTRSEMVTAAALRLAESDPQAALDYAHNAKSVSHGAVVSRILENLAARDPAMTRAALSQLDAEDWADGNSQEQTMATLVRADGAATMAWLQSPEAEVARSANPQLREATFGGWATAFPDAASAWLAAQPAETRPTDCVQQLINSLTHGSDRRFDTAVAWALTLPPSNRRNTVQNVFIDWSEADEPAALAAMEKTPLSSDERFTIQLVMKLRKMSR